MGTINIHDTQENLLTINLTNKSFNASSLYACVNFKKLQEVRPLQHGSRLQVRQGGKHGRVPDQEVVMR
jgi:hypothetical protein